MTFVVLFSYVSWSVVIPFLLVLPGSYVSFYIKGSICLKVSFSLLALIIFIFEFETCTFLLDNLSLVQNIKRDLCTYIYYTGINLNLILYRSFEQIMVYFTVIIIKFYTSRCGIIALKYKFLPTSSNFFSVLFAI